MTKIKTLTLAIMALMLVGCNGSDETAQSEQASATMEAAAPAMQTEDTAVAAVTNDRLKNAESEPEQWMTYGGNYKEQRYSTLDQITTENVTEVGLAWFADLNTNRGQQSTPLFIDGVLYVTEAWSRVSAFDADTGELKWHYNPQVPGEYGGRGCCDVVNRGVAAYDGKIYVGTYDGRLVALDAQTGEEVWSEVTVDQSKNYTITSAPRVANGKVFIGMAGAEYFTRGHVAAHDAQTGELVWKFYTVPGNPELGFENDAMRMAAETWTGEWWQYGGGGSTWDSMTYDPETNLVYFGVGNGAPWNPRIRSPEGGDNLFTISIVAVDADTGEYAWHFQEIPWEEWDFDAVAQITVADLEVDGQMRHVLMQANKAGYYYMLDAYSGELLRANNFVEVNWTHGYDMTTGRPIINEDAQYTANEDRHVIIQPGPQGAHSWHAMSFNPETGLLYIPAQENSMPFRHAPETMPEGNAFRIGVDFFSGDAAYDRPENTIERGGRTRLVAWDPVAAEEVWAIEDTGTSGVLNTAGGLMLKASPQAEELVFYRAEDGEKLHSVPTGATASPGAITYELNGEQYFAQVAGGSAFGGYYAPTYARLLVYKLGGDAVLPEKTPFTQRPFAPPAEFGDANLVAQGLQLYAANCAMCHGAGGQNRGMFPDLRRSPMLHSAEGFNAVVIDGALTERGMVSFADAVDAEQANAIRAYLTQQATVAMNQPAFGGFGAPPPEPEPEDVNAHTQE